MTGKGKMGLARDLGVLWLFVPLPSVRRSLKGRQPQTRTGSGVLQPVLSWALAHQRASEDGENRFETGLFRGETGLKTVFSGVQKGS